MTTILYIHGAFSTPATFAHIRDYLPDHKEQYLEYTVAENLQTVIDKEVARLKAEGERVKIVAHSLGGVLGAIIAQKSGLVTHMVTMGTPFGGNKAADLIKWFNPHAMFESISTGSPLLQKMRRTPIGCSTLSIITTSGGNPMFNEPNDGAVTVSSQVAWQSPDFIEVPYNHFEVLLADQTITIIKEYLFDERDDNDDRAGGLG